MAYLHLARTRVRERSPGFDQSLTRRDTKRSHFITLSDDEDEGRDDYPYSSNHRPVKTSRALTIRDRPGQLERYNIWSDRHKSGDSEEDKIYSRSYRRGGDDDDCDSLRLDSEEREFRLKLQATFSRPRSSHHEHKYHTYLTGSDPFRRKEKLTDEHWESGGRNRHVRERSRHDDFWGDGGFWGDRDGKEESHVERENWSRYRRIKRTKTEEWRPLTGWRRI